MSTKKKFNITDALIILVVLVVAAAAVFVLSAKDASPQGKTKTIVVEFKEKTEEFCSIPQIGDNILDAATKQELGTLVDIKKEAASTNTTSVEEGKVVKTLIPNRYTLYLTIELNSATDSAKIGKSMYIQGRTYACSGYVVEVVK